MKLFNIGNHLRKKLKLVKDKVKVLYGVGGGLLQKSLPFFSSLYVAKNYGADGFASFSFAINTANAIVGIVSMGYVPAILTYLVTSQNDSKDRIANSVGLGLLLSVIGCVVAYFVTLNDFDSLSSFNVLGIVLLLVPSLILLQVGQAVYQGCGYYGSFFIQSTVLVFFVFCIFLSSSFFDGNLFFSLYGWVFLLVGGGSVLFLFCKIGFSDLSVFRINNLAKLILSQANFLFYSGVWMLSIYLCNYKIAKSFEGMDLIYYNIGFQVYAMFLLVPTIIGGVLIPYFAGNKNSNRQSSLIYFCFVVSSVVLVGVGCWFSPSIIRLYEADVIDFGVDVVRLMICSGGILLAITPILQKYLATKSFRVLYCICFSWSLIVLIGIFAVAGNARDVAVFFFFGYVVVGMIVLLYSVRDRVL